MTLLVNVNEMSPAQLDFLHQQIMAKKTEFLQLEMERVKDELAKIQAEREIEKQEFETVKHRLDNVDLTNIDGTIRDRLNRMVRLYASKKGLEFRKGWKDFVQAFNTAYRTNLELKITNYCRNRGIKEISTPEYLERVGLLEDAIRVADKMLNRRSA
jgi:seryl-tRNA synthetase